MVIASSNESGASRRAHRRGMEIRITKTGVSDAIESGGRDHTTEGGGQRQTLVVGHDQQYIGAAWGGTMRGGHQGVDCRALRSILPPNGIAGAGS